MTDTRLREIINANPWFGDWDEWSKLYDRLPVYARAVMSHVYGHHDDTDLPYQYCVLCETLRTAVSPDSPQPNGVSVEGEIMTKQKGTDKWTP